MSDPSPQIVDQLVLAGAILPIVPHGVLLEDHGLAIRDGRIVDLLPAAELKKRYQANSVLDWPHKLLMPGLVDAHTHAAMTLLRGLADDLPLMEWLQEHVWPAEAKNVSHGFCLDGVRLAAAECIRAGVTCVNDMYFFADASAQGFSAAGMRCVANLIVLDFPSAWASNADEYIARGLEVHDSVQGNPLVKTIFAPHAPYTVSDGPLERIRAYADELDIGIHMHVHETEFEVAEAVKTTGKRPWQRLKDLNLLGPGFIAVHMTQLTDEEIAEAAEFGVSVAHCPESNLKLASGFCPVHKLMQAGVNVALGTDGAASNNDLDLLGEMRTAALLAKGVAGLASALPAADALYAATLGGAKALGLDSEIGSLEIGKSADFIAIETTGTHLQPCYQLISHLVYAASRADICDVFVRGKALMRDRNLMTVNEDEAAAKAREWQRRISAQGVDL